MKKFKNYYFQKKKKEEIQQYSKGKMLDQSKNIEKKEVKNSQTTIKVEENIEKKKINVIVKKLEQLNIKFNSVRVKKFIFSDLDTESIVKKIQKAINFIDEIDRKKEEEAKRLGLV